MAAPKTGTILAITLPVLLIASLLGLILIVLAPGAAAVCGTGQGGRADPADVPDGDVAGYSGEQLINAAHIMNAALDAGLDRPAQVLGVMTAMGESSLIVLDYGDEAGPDSRGLFQQRDSWGPLEDRMDPTTSALMFFERLAAVDGWAQMEATLAIHKVQRNADPYHYEKYQDAAEKVVSALSGAVGQCASGDIVLPLSPGYNMTSDYGPRVIDIPGASSWHAAVDLQHWPNNCDDPVYAIAPGTVTFVGEFQVTLKHPDGYDVSYLHMWQDDVLVAVGQQVDAGAQLGATGNSGPSGGCHLDLRINVDGNTNAQVAALTIAKELGAPEQYWGFVNPEEFYALFGIELCGEDCGRNF